MITLKIDGRHIILDGPTTVLDAALRNGIYIPHLCAHPELDSTIRPRSVRKVYRGKEEFEGQGGTEFPGCNLCLVEIEGRDGLHQACATLVEDDMVVETGTRELAALRKRRIAEILEHHPHACLICSQSEGCDRKLCSSNVPEHERCCFKFGACELQKVAQYIGLEQGLPPYQPLEAPCIDTEPVIKTDYNLCIDCIRCVRVCNEVKGAGVLAFTMIEDRVIVGTKAAGLKEAGCKFCGACVEICPTGALAYNYKTKRPKKREKLKVPILPPEKWKTFSRQDIEMVPEAEGVYILYDEEKKLYKVAGVENLRESLMADLGAGVPAYYFSYEEEPMYTARERQLIQQCINKTGRMPPGNEDLDDLF